MRAPRALDPGPRGHLSHLSHSRISRYELCPEAYRLHYVEGLRPQRPPANLVFGKVLHQALARLFGAGEDPVNAFAESWDDMRQIELTYTGKTTWDSLRSTGRGLLEEFMSSAQPRLCNVETSEHEFRLKITGVDIPFVGIIDLVAELEGKRTVVDFKTSASSYRDHEAQMSDQLTAYFLAEPEASQVAFCVLVKTKKPRIEWHVVTRNGRQLAEYLEKVRLLTGRIAAGEFHKRPGIWCTWCDFLPVCKGDDAQARQRLIQQS